MLSSELEIKVSPINVSPSDIELMMGENNRRFFDDEINAEAYGRQFRRLSELYIALTEVRGRILQGKGPSNIGEFNVRDSEGKTTFIDLVDLSAEAVLERHNFLRHVEQLHSVASEQH